MLNNRFVFSFRRSLISTDENDEPWLASVSRGSRKEHYEPSEEEIELAKRATNSIGAFYNEVDMVFTKKGLAIIENNPTPNYVCGQDEGKVNAAVDMLVGNFEAMDQVAPAPAYKRICASASTSI